MQEKELTFIPFHYNPASLARPFFSHFFPALEGNARVVKEIAARMKEKEWMMRKWNRSLGHYDPLSSHEIDGVRKEKERLTAVTHILFLVDKKRLIVHWRLTRWNFLGLILWNLLWPNVCFNLVALFLSFSSSAFLSLHKPLTFISFPLQTARPKGCRADCWRVTKEKNEWKEKDTKWRLDRRLVSRKSTRKKS